MKQWKKSLLYTPKHTKPTDKNLMRLFLPSIVGILICMVCLAGTTWAWFSASVQTGAQTITAASFNVEVAITPTPVKSEGGKYTLAGNTAYTVTLTATGTADEIGGYCIVGKAAGDKHYTTSQIKPGGSLQFTLIPEADGIYTFTAVWGKYSGKADISAGAVIGQEQASGSGTEPSNQPTEDTASTEPVYVVQSGDTLSDIASQYGTAAAKAAAYNGVESPESLQNGQKIKTSPADYEIPAEPSASSAPAESKESAGPEETAPSVDTVESEPAPAEPFPLQSPPMEEPATGN